MRAGEEGVATVTSVALMGLLGSVGFLAVALGQQAGARGELSAAADIAALAGAQSLADPCTSAAESAATNHVELLDCALDGTDVLVRVRRPPTPLSARILTWLGQEPMDLVAVARAGPPADARD